MIDGTDRIFLFMYGSFSSLNSKFPLFSSLNVHNVNDRLSVMGDCFWVGACLDLGVYLKKIEIKNNRKFQTSKFFFCKNIRIWRSEQVWVDTM